jgi:hypothetical protein
MTSEGEERNILTMRVIYTLGLFAPPKLKSEIASTNKILITIDGKPLVPEMPIEQRRQ